MRTEAFTSFAERYAQAMGGTQVYVTFGGTEAFTDGRRINLPAMPAGTMLSPWQVKVYSGYLDHEIAHVKYTNMKAIKLDRRKEPVKYGLFNIFEDIRIENRLIDEYAGTKIYLDACTQQIEYDKRDKIKKPTVGYMLLEAIYRECYETYRDAECAFTQKETIDQFPELKQIQKELRALKTMSSQKEAEELAERVYDLLPKNADYGQQGADLQPDEDGTIMLPFIVVQGTGHGNPMQALAEAMEQLFELAERKMAMEGLIEKIEEENGDDEDNKGGRASRRWGSKVLPPVGTNHDRIFVPSGKNRSSYESVRNSAAAEITAAKRMLNIYLQSRTTKAWERGLPEGKLDDANLANLFLGDTNLFKRRRERQLIHTSVQMMVDCSGSMNARDTQTAAVILAEALNGVPQIKLSVAGFTTNDHYYRGNSGGRLNGLDILMFKDFDEPYHSAQDRLGAIRTYGYTPLGEAYGHGFARLMKRKETRRVLWIVTDGEPFFDTQDSEHNEYLLMKRIHRKCKVNGIQVIGMNIGRASDEAKKCCDSFRAIGSHRQLPQAVLEIMKEIVQ